MSDKSYTDEQVAKVMEAQKLDRIRAIHLIKRLGVEKALAYTKEVKPAKAPKAKAAKADKPKAERKTRESKYSKDAIIAAWERGRRPSEIALLETPGIKGVSSVYVSRVLFGSKNSGGVSPDQAKRVKVEAERREKRSKEIAEAK